MSFLQKSAISANNTVQKDQEKTSLCSAFREEFEALDFEAKALTAAFDASSKLIRDVEASLSRLNVNFPFQFRISKKNHDTELISWEQDEGSKRYRLLYTFGWEDDCDMRTKPLIEADIDNRLRVSEHLGEFIVAFKEHLRARRIAIQGELDDVLF